MQRFLKDLPEYGQEFLKKFKSACTKKMENLPGHKLVKK